MGRWINVKKWYWDWEGEGCKFTQGDGKNSMKLLMGIQFCKRLWKTKYVIKVHH